MSPELFRQTREALQLNGLGDKTQEAYLRAVRLLLDVHARCSIAAANSDGAGQLCVDGEIPKQFTVLGHPGSSTVPLKSRGMP